MIEKIKEFAKSVQAELVKVTWPNWDETVTSTAITIIVVAMVGVFIGLNDFLYDQLLRTLFK